MAFGNYYGMGGYQPNYYNPTGAIPDALAQYKTQYQAPYQPQVAPMAQQMAQPQNSSGLIWVQGEAGAKAYPVAPGQSVLLMDSENSKFYIKSADASGMPMPLRIFPYSEYTGEQTAPAPNDGAQNAPGVDVSQFVTREEFEKRISQLSGGKFEKAGDE